MALDELSALGVASDLLSVRSQVTHARLRHPAGCLLICVLQVCTTQRDAVPGLQRDVQMVVMIKVYAPVRFSRLRLTKP